MGEDSELEIPKDLWVEGEVGGSWENAALGSGIPSSNKGVWTLGFLLLLATQHPTPPGNELQHKSIRMEVGGGRKLEFFPWFSHIPSTLGNSRFGSRLILQLWGGMREKRGFSWDNNLVSALEATPVGQEKGWERVWDVWEAAAKGKLFGMLPEELPGHPKPPPWNLSFQLAQRGGKSHIPLQAAGSGIIVAGLLPSFPLFPLNSLLVLREPFPSPTLQLEPLPVSRWDDSRDEGMELETWKIPQSAPMEAPASGMRLQGRRVAPGSPFPARNEVLTLQNPAPLIPDGLMLAAR